MRPVWASAIDVDQAAAARAVATRVMLHMARMQNITKGLPAGGPHLLRTEQRGGLPDQGAGCADVVAALAAVRVAAGGANGPVPWRLCSDWMLCCGVPCTCV